MNKWKNSEYISITSCLVVIGTVLASDKKCWETLIGTLLLTPTTNKTHNDLESLRTLFSSLNLSSISDLSSHQAIKSSSHQVSTPITSPWHASKKPQPEPLFALFVWPTHCERRTTNTSDESETRYARTDILGLLKECHRLSLAIPVSEPAQKDPDDQDTKLISFPKHIQAWKHFTEVCNSFWEIMTDECERRDQKRFPSSWECDLSLEESQPVKNSQDVHTTRHLTAHRFVSRIWGGVDV